MRILQVITLSELGGAQSVVINIANKLCENHDVIVAAGGGDDKMFELLNPKIIKEKIPNLVRNLSPVKELKAIFSMRLLYYKYRPDIIHLHSSKAGILGRLAFPKSKIVYTVHGFDSIRLAYRKFLPIERILQNRCASIVAVSKYDEENLNSERIFNQVCCIYNGIYDSQPPSINPIRDLPKYDKIILCIARLSPPKNYDLFLEVAKLLPAYAFVWIGNQNEPDFDYPENVFFLGNIKNAGAYAEYADLFFLPSNYEGLPMVILEALSKGTPVVASNVGGISEILDGRNGYAVENDAHKMADRIKEILENPALRQEMSKHARETYQEKFTVGQMVDGYLKLYNKIYNNNNE